MSNDRIPMFPDQRPQQRLYEVVELPEIPENFEASCLIYPDRNDHIWSLEKSEMPRRFPGRSKFIAQVEWAWDPHHDSLHSYYLSSNTRKTHWFLWIRWPDDASFELINSVIFAYCPRVSNDPHLIAIHLLRYGWEVAARGSWLDRPHWINGNELLSVSEIIAVARAVWQ